MQRVPNVNENYDTQFCSTDIQMTQYVKQGKIKLYILRHALLAQIRPPDCAVLQYGLELNVLREETKSTV